MSAGITINTFNISSQPQTGVAEILRTLGVKEAERDTAPRDNHFGDYSDNKASKRHLLEKISDLLADIKSELHRRRNPDQKDFRHDDISPRSSSHVKDALSDWVNKHLPKSSQAKNDWSDWSKNTPASSTPSIAEDLRGMSDGELELLATFLAAAAKIVGDEEEEEEEEDKTSNNDRRFGGSPIGRVLDSLFNPGAFSRAGPAPSQQSSPISAPVKSGAAHSDKSAHSAPPASKAPAAAPAAAAPAAAGAAASVSGAQKKDITPKEEAVSHSSPNNQPEMLVNDAKQAADQQPMGDSIRTLRDHFATFEAAEYRESPDSNPSNNFFGSAGIYHLAQLGTGQDDWDKKWKDIEDQQGFKTNEDDRNKIVNAARNLFGQDRELVRWAEKVGIGTMPANDGATMVGWKLDKLKNLSNKDIDRVDSAEVKDPMTVSTALNFAQGNPAIFDIAENMQDATLAAGDNTFTKPGLEFVAKMSDSDWEQLEKRKGAQFGEEARTQAKDAAQTLLNNYKELFKSADDLGIRKIGHGLIISDGTTDNTEKEMRSYDLVFGKGQNVDTERAREIFG